MKLNEVFGRQNFRGGDTTSGVFHFELEDPRSGDMVEASVRGYFNYESGDVGFGVGPGKSPYAPSWEFDYAEVEEPFTFLGKTFQKGQYFDVDQFVPYMSKRQAADPFPTDDLDTEPYDDREYEYGD